MVSDGRVAWQVEPDLAQAVRLGPSQAQGWAAMFQGRGDTFHLRQPRPGLWEGRAPGEAAIKVEMGASGPRTIEVEDTLTASFGAWESVEEGRGPSFTFTPPPGMDVVGSPTGPGG